MLFLLPIYLWSLLVDITFKTEQLQHARVVAAYASKEQAVQTTLRKHNLKPNQLNLYVRAFKREQIVELWGKNQTDKKFQLLKTFPVCALSGSLGPKRRQGDRQIPEGFYSIDGFNPNSLYHLSLHVNYPNNSDKILGYQKALGGDIFVHGDCVTIGCLPLTDDKIKEFYVYCVEARASGQQGIPITIFPAHLDDNSFRQLNKLYADDKETLNLWADLKAGYDIFEKQKQLPTITFLPNGRHKVEL